MRPWALIVHFPGAPLTPGVPVWYYSHCCMNDNNRKSPFSTVNNCSPLGGFRAFKSIIPSFIDLAFAWSTYSNHSETHFTFTGDLVSLCIR